MDRESLRDLFAPFGPVIIKRLFSGFGISVDEINFAIAVRGALYLRVDSESVVRFEAEGSAPFQYEMKGQMRPLSSYWQVPNRLYDEPDEFAIWARRALAAAEQAALVKRAKAARKVAKGKKRSTKAEASSARRVRKTPAKVRRSLQAT